MTAGLLTTVPAVSRSSGPPCANQNASATTSWPANMAATANSAQRLVPTNFQTRGGRRESGSIAVTALSASPSETLIIDLWKNATSGQRALEQAAALLGCQISGAVHSASGGIEACCGEQLGMTGMDQIQRRGGGEQRQRFHRLPRDKLVVRAQQCLENK